MDHQIVSREDWIRARIELMEQEKAATRLRDDIAEKRRALPWVRLEKDYRLSDARGETPLSDIFGGKSQLIVYHFMFGQDWEEGCPSCSFWADNFENNHVHLRARDVAFITVSTAPPSRLERYKKRMGWTFLWYSDGDSGFNADFGVTFSQAEIEKGNKLYNFDTQAFPFAEAPGVSVFYKDEDGAIFHTYSAYSRGLDLLNAAYQYLDIVPKGRDEAGLSNPQAWVRRHDSYDTETP